MNTFEQQLKQEFDKLQSDYDGLEAVMERIKANVDESFSDGWDYACVDYDELNDKIDNMLMNGDLN